MPEPNPPGVYVEEIPTAPAIPAAPTSRTAFLGSAVQGPVGKATTIRSIDEFRATFGSGGTLHGAVDLFFVNGGREAIVVRLQKPELKVPPNTVEAKEPLIVSSKAIRGEQKISPALKSTTTADGDPGSLTLDAACYLGDRGGIRALDHADYDLLYMPPSREGVDVDLDVLSAAAAHCRERRAMLLIDAPRSWSSSSDAEQGIGELRSALGGNAINAALYFPYLRRGSGASAEEVPPGAAVAGIIARTDAQRGVWKAPAGLEAQIRGVEGTTMALSDTDLGRLSSLAINVVRPTPGAGTVVWGARTLDGASTSGSEWRYVPVRRTALFIEESLRQGLQWTAFEPNDPALWSRVRSSVEAFLIDLFRRGAFQGAVPRDAFFVRCGAETSAPADIGGGTLDLEVGFAPLRPAEFIVLRVRLSAGGR